MLVGVLGGNEKEWFGKFVRATVHGDLPLLHRLEGGGLGTRSRPIDLVDKDNVGKQRAGLELPVLGLAPVHGDACQIGGKKVGRSLDSPEGTADGSGDGLGEQRFADARNIFDE